VTRRATGTLIALTLIGGAATTATASQRGAEVNAVKIGTQHVQATCARALLWNSASQAVGRIASIKGLVAGTKWARSSNGSPTFLNLGRDYPDPSRFTVLIWIENRASFGTPERRYLGRKICVTGLVQLYRGVPEIIARSPRQIRILS
jgi:hypothetical protein